MKQIVWFDDEIRTRSGKRVPFYDSTIIEEPIRDQQEMYFHICYGRSKLYRLHKVDEKNYIAEDLHKSKWK